MVELMITAGVASRRGARDHCADAGHAYRADDGSVTAAVIDDTPGFGLCLPGRRCW